MRITALLLFHTLLSAQSLTDWSVPPVLKAAGYSAELRREGCRGATPCAVLLAPDGTFGNLSMTFDAAPYRGRSVRLRAWIRIEPDAPSGHARMFLEVNLPTGKTGFSDNMGDRPISSSAWQSYEISGEVASDAESVGIGVMSSGKGRVWVDGAAFEILPDTPAGVRETFRKLYARLDAAYGQRDMDALASLALPDALIHMGSTTVRLTDAVLQIMNEMEKGTKYTSRSTVTSVRISGTDATVAVNNESTLESKGGRRTVITTNRDTWTKSGGGWKLKESSLISTAPLTRPPAPAPPRR